MRINWLRFIRPFTIRNRYLVIADGVLLAGTIWLGYVFRFEGAGLSATAWRTAKVFAVGSVPVTLVIFYFGGLYRRLWRYASPRDLERIVAVGSIAGLASAIIGVVVLPLTGLLPGRVPLSVLAFCWVGSVAVAVLSRWTIRLVYRRQPRRRRAGDRPIIIAGAGAAGGMIARELRRNPQLGMEPVGFVDDDRRKHGLHLNDLPVLGSFDDLPAIVASMGIRDVVIAMPRASGKVVRRVVELVHAARAKAVTVPGLFEILSGRKSVSALRPVEIQDLLRREPVAPDLALAGKLATGRTVLVTGAGGSIGSELCRQLAVLRPSRLILLGHGENSIFAVQQELATRHRDLTITPVICDIRNQKRLRAIFRRYRPFAVLHAAAHKHVPLMEDNVAEAVTNNVMGTRNVVEASAEAGVEHFVLISSDKAVRPVSVMGACKRAAEQIVQGVAESSGRNYVSVRFGNVLGSRGSVVPTFLAQIAAGGPVTITDPEMRRYFMSIPEAVQLVLQAAVLGRGGEVFVLEMGEPVRILDLAHDLIRLSGLQVDTDIEIAFTGLRPGEKLCEDLFLDSEQAARTSHPKILCVRNADLPQDAAVRRAALIRAALEGQDDAELRVHLSRVAEDFEPGPGASFAAIQDSPSTEGLGGVGGDGTNGGIQWTPSTQPLPTHSLPVTTLLKSVLTPPLLLAAAYLASGAVTLSAQTAGIPVAVARSPGLAGGADSSDLRPGDVLRLRIWREPDLSGDFTLDTRGFVVLPKLGAMDVASVPADSLQPRLLRAYAEYLNNPSVEVVLLRRISVLGAVQKPGVYPVDPTMTVADVVALAGGAGPDGKRDQVELRRDGKVIFAKLQQGSRVADSPIRSGDQVYVPQRSWVSRNTALVATFLGTAVSLGIALSR